MPMGFHTQALRPASPASPLPARRRS